MIVPAPKLNKVNYLLIYFISVSFFLYLKPFGYLREIGNGALILFFDLIWLYYGYTKNWNQLNSNSLELKKYNRITWLILISLIPSMFMATELFNQNFLQNLISYRNFSLFLAIPVLLKIQPSEEEIVKAINIYAIIFLVACLLGTFYEENLLVFSERDRALLRHIARSNSSDFLYVPLQACYEIITISLYFYCIKLWSRYSSSDMIRVLFLLSIFIIVQNRSTLFPALIFVGITLLKCKINHWIKPLLIITVGSIAVYLSIDIIDGLLHQTQKEFNNNYDPRFLALRYFLDIKGRTIPEILFGTGNISFQTSSYVEKLQAHNIHYSDVGFIGFWHQFGILPIIIFIYFLIKAALSHLQPWNSRYLAIHILICGFTISYFETPAHMLWFILFYYQYARYNSLSISSNKILYYRC